MLHFGMRGEVLKHLKRRRVQPLQIVKKQREWVLRSSKYVDEAPEDPLKSILTFLRRKLEDRRLLPDDEGKLGDEADHDLAIYAYRIEQHAAPSSYLLIVAAEDLTHQRLKGLSQSRIGNVALVLIKLAAGEQTARRDQNLVQFIDDRGFSNAGIAGDEHDLRRLVGDDPIERGHEVDDFRLTAI
jgi:hypothetical protein